MKKNSVFLTILLSLYTFLFSASAFSNSPKEISGVLQAYWFPQWTDEGRVRPPLIMMRFFETGSRDNKTYNLYDMKDRNGVKDYFDIANTERFIKSNFKNTPEEFFKFKEGHVEQSGKLLISDIVNISECDNKKTYAKFNSFTPVVNADFEVKEIELESECDSEPYSVMFTIKEGHENVFLKSDPSISSKNIVGGPVSQPLVKIKTIDSQWVKVALYDASQPGSRSKIEGYVRFSDLDIAN